MSYRKGYDWGFADKNKKTVIPPQFENAFPFQEGDYYELI